MMMPSRRLAGAIRQGARFNRRFMSTPPRPLPALNSRSTGRIFQGSVISLAAHARLASTSAPVATPSVSAATTALPPTYAPDATATDSNPFDIGEVGEFAMNLDITEKIGYLKEIGLDYGWGPTAVIEWSLEHVHFLSGMPWWGSIAATAFLYRLALVPMFMKASENGAKMRAMQPITKPLNEKMMDAMKNGDRTTAMLMRQEMMQINKAAGVSTFGMLVPSIVQGVFGFCAFRLLRAMANLPVPGFETGGFLWVTDLTQIDPYFLLPAIMGGTLHFILRMGGETGAPMSVAMKPFLLYIFPGIVFITTSWLPAALNVWLCTTGIMGVTQVHLFKRTDVRRFFGLSPMIDPEQARRDAVAAGLAKHGDDPKTIDVKAKSYPTDRRPVYQAPNIKFSTNSAPPKHAATSSASAVQAAQSPFDAVKNKGFGMFNKAGESVDGMKKSVSDAYTAFFESKGGKKSKTRSAEFMKAAESYERRWQKLNKK